MKAIFCKGFDAHYNDAILNVAINLKLNSADLHLTKWGGGGGRNPAFVLLIILNFHSVFANIRMLDDTIL